MRLSRLLLTSLALCCVSQLSAQWSIKEDHPMADNTGVRFQVFSEEEWNASNFASEEELQWFRDAKYGMFIHFGLSTFANENLSWGVNHQRKLPDAGGSDKYLDWASWPEKLELPDFNAEDVARIAKDAGMTYVVLIVKHHDGFHLWDTDYSNFKVTNTPFGRDFTREIAIACRAAGLKFGIYYSQRDWYHPDYAPVDPERAEKVRGLTWKPKPGEANTHGPTHAKYLEYQANVVRELCTEYGKLDVFWFDAAYWGGMFTADMWDAENLTRMIRELQPGIVINNRASLPGDFDTPEGRVGFFQSERPWESCMHICKTWSYSDTPNKTPKQIIKILVGTLTGDGNLLMSWGQEWGGAFNQAQTDILVEVGDWVNYNEAAIFKTRGGPWRPQDWGGATYRDSTVYLHISSMPENHQLKLGGLKNKVLSARIHKGEAVSFTQDGELLELTIPEALVDPLSTVVELTLQKPVSELIDAEVGRISMFDDPEYGGLLTTEEKLKLKPDTVIDLKKAYSVTGLRVQLPNGKPVSAATLRAYVSEDGDDWTEVELPKRASVQLEFPVNRYQAGAYIPGVMARYIKLVKLDEKRPSIHVGPVEIFGK